MLTNERTYTSDNIKSIDGISQIRAKPTIFMGSLGPEGVYRLFTEIYANIVDEFNEGRGNKMIVKINSQDHTIYVEDNCSGIPIEKFEDVILRPFTGGKYDKNAYLTSSGTNGVGCKLVAAASDMLIVDTYRDGKHAHGEFAKGIKIKIEVTEDKKHASGTIFFFRPDITLLKDISMSYQKYRDTLEICSYMNPGLTIDFTFDDNQHFYHHPKGLIEYYEKRIIDLRKYNVVNQAIHFCGETLNSEKLALTGSDEQTDTPIFIKYEAFVSWATNVRQANVESYVNGLKTKDGGTHVKGVTSAIQDSIKKHIAKYNLWNNSQYNIEGLDILENCVILVDAKHSVPLYSTQIKDELTNEDMRVFVKEDFSAKFTEWLELNQAPTKRIIDLIILAAKARFAASNARKAVRANAATTNTSALIGIEAYRACRSKDPEKCELFIVEGESAGGSAKSGCDDNYQAIYMLKGVPPNTYNSKDILKYLNDSKSVIGNLVKVLRCGMGSSLDLSKLGFHKIIIMADADPDGSHIIALLLGFFFQFYPELIAEGKIYIANPPLFRFSFSKNKHMYVSNMDMYWNILDAAVIEDFNICYIFDKKVYPIQNPDFFKGYLMAIRDYDNIVNIAGTQTNIHPELLEYIIINYDSIIKSKSFRLKNFELTRFFSKELNCDCIEGIFNNVFHHIELTGHLFQLCAKILESLHVIKWSNLVLQHKKSKTILGPSPYQVANTISKLVKNGADITRMKGLGEMRPKELYETTMNPETRTLTQVSMDSEKIQQIISKLDTFIGSDIQSRKQFYSQYL